MSINPPSGRPSSRTINSDASYQFDVTYNSLGTPESLTYPVSTAGVRVKMKYGYTGGVLSSIQDFTGNVNGPVLWNLNLLDARANAVSETYGNGLWLQNAFDPLTGEAKTRQAGTGGQTSNVQNLAYPGTRPATSATGRIFGRASRNPSPTTRSIG